MTDNQSTKSVLSICATTSDRVKDLVIKDGQMIFVHDKSRLAFDYKGKRTFYNQIQEVETEYARTSLSAPDVGYYFVIETAVLWFYQDDWIQITTPPEETIFIGVEVPELGKKNQLYVDTQKCEISVWDEDTSSYVVVADKTDITDVAIDTVTQDDIDSLF